MRKGHMRSRRRRRMWGAAIAIPAVCVVVGLGVGQSSAKQLDPPPQASGKTWNGTIYNSAPYFPYVKVLDVLDPDKELDLTDPNVKYYYVMPFAAWEIDCKYYHPTLGWMYRGSHIQGIESSGGPSDGYYETSYLATILEGGQMVDDIDEICYPGGEEPGS
jgi:hypothetical protein